MQVYTVDEFKAEGIRLFGEEGRNWKFKCVRCGTVQTWQEFVDAGFSIEKAETLIGFSCIGRWVEGKGCDWTLGGLLPIHKMEVIDEKGNRHPRFEFAEPDK